MKILLREQQMDDLIKMLPLIDNTKLVDLKKDAPNLSKFMDKFKSLKKNGINLINKNLPTSNNDDNPDAPDENSVNFAKNIPGGNQMFLPLGKKFPIGSRRFQKNVLNPYTKKMGDHLAVDINSPSGTPVYSPLDGIIIASDSTNSCGGRIKIKHEKLITAYCHLSKMVVNLNDKVKKGQLIGYSGGAKTDPHPGFSTGSHLHYAIYDLANNALNPLIIQPDLV